MKIIPNDTINTIINSGKFIGANKANAQVTVEPYWRLNVTDDMYADWQRGPYRWWLELSNNPWEVVVPNIKSIDINRSIDQPVASCTITLYNQWHNVNTESPELLSQLGKPGYLWFDRGRETDSESIQVSRWNQSFATGAKLKDGTVAEDPPGSGDPFSWFNVLVPNALLRTYHGWGGHSLSIDAALAAGNLTQTGVWLIDKVSAGTDGMLTLECRDVGRLLVDQRIFPPLVPSDLYPLEYVPKGAHTYDSPWDTPPVSLGSGQPAPTTVAVGIVPCVLYSSSPAIRAGQAETNTTVSIDGHAPADCIDKNGDTWSWSQATASPEDHVDWWQFWVSNSTGVLCNQITILPYGGGYTLYVSVSEDDVTWIANGDGSLIPEGDNQDGVPCAINYVDKFPVPKALPGEERAITYDLPDTYNLKAIRLTFRHHTYDSGGYRCGLRDLQLINSNEYVGGNVAALGGDDFGTAIAPHPFRGYWAVSVDGVVWTGGDAVHYGNGVNSEANPVVSIAAHPHGTGYWLLHAGGQVEAFGAATDYGEYTGIAYNPSFGPLGAYSNKAMGITSNHDGTGYWVIYSTGNIKGFGNVGAYSDVDLPLSNETIFMEAISTDWPVRYLQKRGTAIKGHPSGIGFWAADGCGRVTAYGVAQHYGEFLNRTYNLNSANEFKLAYAGEYVDSIDCTSTGKGYWLSCGSGRIGQFGDAVGRGPIDIYAHVRNDSIPQDPYLRPSPEVLKALFRSLAQGFCKMPDDVGFYVVMGDGTVSAYTYDWWGNPAWWGKGGYRWHDGIYDDCADIIKELLAWSGWALGAGSNVSDGWTTETPEPDTMPLHAFIESTGINSDSKISIDQIDKQTILDVINSLREIVAYLFWIDSNGAAHFESSNTWKAGNYITSDVGESTKTHTTEIPVFDERTNLVSYSATADGESILYEIITGSTVPSFSDPTRVSFYRFRPPNYNMPIKTSWYNNDATLDRNIVKQAMWTNEVFTESEEQKLMAELIALYSFFAQRTGSVTTVGNPAIEINDQIKIIERNTAEAYIHYIRGIQSTIDLDSGMYTMTMTTNWLGTEDSWVITRDNVVDPLTQVVISERIDGWQTTVGLGLDTGTLGAGDTVNISISTTNPVPVTIGSSWTWNWTFICENDIENLQLSVDVFNEYVLGEFELEINSSNYSVENLGQYISIGDLTAGTYSVTMTGTAAAAGNGNLLLRAFANNTNSVTMFGSLHVYGTSSGTPTVNIISPSTTEIDTNQTVSFSASSSILMGIYSWDFGDGQSSTQIAPTHTYLAADTYEVVLTVTDPETGLSDSDTIELVITDPAFYISYVFVSNNDSVLYNEATPSAWELNGDLLISPNIVCYDAKYMIDGNFNTDDFGVDEYTVLIGVDVKDPDGNIIISGGSISGSLADDPGIYNTQTGFVSGLSNGDGIVIYTGAMDGTTLSTTPGAYLGVYNGSFIEVNPITVQIKTLPSFMGPARVRVMNGNDWGDYSDDLTQGDSIHISIGEFNLGYAFPVEISGYPTGTGYGALKVRVFKDSVNYSEVTGFITSS